MEAYTDFAAVYDIFMDNIPYERWAEDTANLLAGYGIREGIVAELGCGTGSLTELMSSYGYDMIGIDSSEDMLSEAMDKRYESGSNILYLCQDMREFELYGTCAAFISRCDSINYITELSELEKVFALVNNYLDPDGIFIFDCNTVYKYRELLADNTIAENRAEGSFIWENSFDADTGINVYALTLYIREGEYYKRYEETHIQRAYSIEELKTAADRAGLIWENAVDADTGTAPGACTERMLIVLRENGKVKE